MTFLNIGRFRVRYSIVLLFILVLAAVLRFVGLDWDDGYYLHPDERFMVMVTVDTAWPHSVSQYFDSDTSPLNPYNTRHGTFVYGTFPMFLTKAISGFFDNDVYGEAHLAGRALSALSDTGTVFLTAWIARRFFGNWAGILGGFLIACTMLHIQTAHYYTVDAMSVFFATATFAATVNGWDRKSLGWFAMAGLMAGLAGASKPNYLIALAFIALPVLEMIRLHGPQGLIPWSGIDRDRFPVIPAASLSALVAFWTFRVAQPYAFSGPGFWNISLDDRWVNDLRYWSMAQSGLIDIKSSIQWVERTPVVYILDNMVRWGMGPPLGIAALAALGFAVYRIVRARTWPSWWMLGMVAWSVAQIALYGTNMAQAQRYLMPVYPFLIVFAAGLLVELVHRSRTSRWTASLPSWANPGSLLIIVVVVYTAFYAVAFDSLFVRPLSRVQASEWIYDNVPAGSTLTGEYWDDGLPMRLEGEDPTRFRYVTLDLYAYEGPESLKLERLIGQINQADYIILSSNRIIGSVPRQPERYPMATRYYEMLVSGELGFEMVADFSQTPELFGIRLDDTDAEETLTVYEHPYVRIFQKTDAFDVHAVYHELNSALGYGGVNYLPGDPLGHQMLLSDEEMARYSDEATWSGIFDPGGFTNRSPAVWWYVGMQLLTIPALPFTWLLFRRSPDYGYAIAKSLGLIVVTWLAWLIASLHILPFGPVPIAIGWAVVLGAGLLTIRRRINEFVAALASRWRWILGTEIIFLTAFTGMTWIRSLDSVFWTPSGSDQTPFWLAIFNATARSPYFPPYDPWFSGGALHLPYWGHMPWITLTRLTGVLPTTAYTLAFAGIFALVCITVWSAAAALVSSIIRSRARAAWIALVAPLIIAVFGSLAIARRAGTGLWVYSARPGDWLVPGSIGDTVYGFIQIMTHGLPTEATAASEALVQEQGAPIATLLSGNLNPVTTALPLISLVIAVAIGVVLPHERGCSCQWSLTRLDISRMIIAGALAGTMLASTTWGFLPTLGIVVVATLIRVATVHGWNHAWPPIRNAVLCGLLIGGTALVSAFPFLQGFTSTQREMVNPALMDLDVYLLIHGVALVVLLSYLVIQSGRVLGDVRNKGLTGRLTSVMVTMIAIAAIILALLVGNILVFSVIVLLLIGVTLWRVQDQPGHLMVIGLVTVGVIVTLMQNVMPMTADIDGTSPAHQLSTYTWIVFGIGATAALAWLLDRLGSSRNPLIILGGAAWVIVMALMIASTVLYPALATSTLADESNERRLDAIGFFDPEGSGDIESTGALASDRDAARWLMQNVEGLPVILEGQTADWQYGGRISAMTGFPAVIGWNTPQRMMRPGWNELVWQRQDAVQEVLGSMGTFESVEPLLHQYDVQLIYIGPLERQLFSDIALRKFATAEENGQLDILYQGDDVIIYSYSLPRP